ncbi:hypothetical protein D3C78_1308630 [compost metagenome]
MSAGRQAAQQWLEKFAQLLELIDVVQFAGIKDHRLELGTQPCDPLSSAQVGAGEAVDIIGKALGKCLDLVCQGAAAQ